MRFVAEGPECGNWPTNLGREPQNLPHTNLGCATQHNLAAMVANPADLVQPRGESPSWTQRRTVVFEKYRSGQSAETNYPNVNRGTVSDVAK